MEGKGIMKIRAMKGEDDNFELYEGGFANDLFEGYGELQ
jgi:hypothetical protein